MIKKILIKHNSQVVFKGSIMAIPVKKEAIIKESIELFDDDDPCIIHTSFIVKKFAERINDIYTKTKDKIIHVNNYKDTFDFLDIDSNDNTVIEVLK